MRIATHDSRFHTDDTFAVATLLLKFPDAEVVRTRDRQVHNASDYVVDTGMVYDPSKNRFDHHMPGGAGERENGIPYASFGLVWKEFGGALAGGEREAQKVDEKLAQPIDAHDNGVAIAEYKFEGVVEYTMGDYLLSYLDDQPRTPEGLYTTFMHNVGIAKSLLEREIARAKKNARGERMVREIYAQSSDKRIIELPEGGLPWESALKDEPELLYAVYPRPDGGWSVGAMPDFTKAFGHQRKPLPAEWAGKEKEELQRITGVSDAKFAHNKLFMAAAGSREGALALAKLALEN